MLLFPFRYLWWLISRIRRARGRPPEYVMFVLESDLPALPDPPRPFWQRFASRPRLSVRELGERFDAIANDPRIKGVILHLRPVGMPMATLQDLRELVAKLRQSGRRVVAWAPFYTTGTYYLACACDEILLMPTGTVQPLGFARTGMFLRDGLARFGIEADFVQISPYKSAADPLTKSRMSPEFREQVTWLLESQHKAPRSGETGGRIEAAAYRHEPTRPPRELSSGHQPVQSHLQDRGAVVDARELSGAQRARGVELRQDPYPARRLAHVEQMEIRVSDTRVDDGPIEPFDRPFENGSGTERSERADQDRGGPGPRQAGRHRDKLDGSARAQAGERRVREEDPQRRAR